MDKEQIWSLAHRVAKDRDFRARLENDPVAALAELGITVSPNDIPDPVQLPSAQEIEAALDEFAEHVLCHTPQWVFIFLDR